MAMKPSPNNVSSLPMPTSRTVPVSNFKTKTAVQDPKFKTPNAALLFFFYSMTIQLTTQCMQKLQSIMQF